MATDAQARTITPREIALLIAVGVALRILWMILVRAWTEPVFLGEATKAALALANRGVIGDVYFPGQGPSAHLLPTMILVAGGIERLFGPNSAAANLALAIWALAQVAVGFALTTLLFRRLGASRAALVGGLGFLCLIPAHIASEAADFRVWEGALAYDLAAANLLWMVVLGQRPTIGARALTGAAVLAAAAFFVGPPAGLGAGAAWGVFALGHLSVRQTARLVLLGACALAALVTPWALRNRAQLGEPVLLRSNFGLELAIGNFDGALDAASPGAAAAARIAAVRQNRERMLRAGGEVAYSRQVGAATRRWIAAHPWTFARLSLHHYRQFFIPDTWVETATNWDGANRLRVRLFQLVGLLGLVGLFAGLWRRRRFYLLLAAYIAVCALPYAVVQPIPRYGYIVYPLLVLLAAQAVASLGAMCWPAGLRRGSQLLTKPENSLNIRFL